MGLKIANLFRWTETETEIFSMQGVGLLQYMTKTMSSAAVSGQ